MVTEHSGLLTSSQSSTGNRVLTDYKDAVKDYKVTDLPLLSMFTQPFTTETGGNIDITFAKPSMTLEEIEEGNTPKYQHADFRNEVVQVREYGIAVGVTRRMIEDSRFSEVEIALNEARRAVDRHVTEHLAYLIFGVAAPSGKAYRTVDIGSGSYDSDTEIRATEQSGWLGNFVTGDTDYRANEYGLLGFTNGAGIHYVTDDDSTIKLDQITAGIEKIGNHGYNANTVLIGPSDYKALLDLADFTVPFTAEKEPSKGGIDFVNTAVATGLVGQLYGLSVIMSAYVPSGHYGIFDTSIKPIAYVERRGLTVEEANPGFGIVGSYMSMRYGFRIIQPEVGYIVKKAQVVNTA